MFNLFSKARLSTLIAALSFITMSSSLMGWDCCNPCACDRFYIGAFGGGLFSNSSNASQLGTAFFLEAAGGPLAVNARGRLSSTSTGFGGVQLGYEWAGRAYAPAIELEAFWYGHSRSGELLNATDRIEEHDFLDSFHTSNGVYLVNAVFSANNRCFWGFTPYIGAGVGATRISLSNASSVQIAPPEAGINHFNSQTSDSTWAFAAQIKAGLRYTICKSLHVFGEYRYLFIDSSNFILGATIYPTGVHVPTSPWNFNIRSVQYNAFTVGIQYDL